MGEKLDGGAAEGDRPKGRRSGGKEVVDKCPLFSGMVALRAKQLETPMEAPVAEEFLLNQIPLRFRALIPPVLKDARAAAAIIAKAEPVLQVPSAEDNHGRLISWAVDLGIQKLIDSNQWPVSYRWRNFARPTGRYLQIVMSHSVMSISQVSDPTIQPRDVRFRQNARLNNEPYLDLKEFEDVRQVAGLPSFLLIHGRVERGELAEDFAHIGIPHPTHSKDYIYKTPNLMNLPHPVTTELPPVEDTESDAVMTLKEEIEKWRRDNGFEE